MGIPIFVIFFIIGWSGIEVEGSITKEQCHVDYNYYYVEPLIKNVWECQNPFYSISPCGTDSRLIQYNAQVEIIKCLCNDISENNSIIVDYYNKEMTRLEHDLESNDSDFICTEGAQPKARL